MRSPTPIWGAARPAPSFDAMVSFMSWTSARNSGVPMFSTFFAGSRRTGCPILSTSRTDMALHDPGDDEPHLFHCSIDNPRDVVQRDAIAALGAPRRRVHADGDLRVGD